MMTLLTPEDYAQELLVYCNILNDIPIEPMHICEKLHLEVQYKPFESIEGVLVNRDCQTKIGIRPNHTYPARTKLTLAHELGHLILPHHTKYMYQCTSEDISSYRPNNVIENEANDFAAELLMPEELIKNDMIMVQPGLQCIQHISNRYGTSLTASAIKYAKSVNFPMAIVQTKVGGSIDWAYSVNNFKYVERGLVHYSTVAHNYFFHNQELNGTPQLVNSTAWHPCDHGHKLIEETVSFPNLHTTLSILTIPE